MAYAVKYLFAWKSTNGTDRKIKVLVDGYSGSPIQRALGRGPILKKQKSGTVCGTSLEFYPECTIDGEFAEFYTSDPKAYKVELYAGSTLLWTGYITPELYSEPDIAPPYDVQVIATDGIGELKLYDYVAQGTVTLRALLGSLLSYTGLSTDVNLISSLKPGSGGAGSLLSKSINLDFMAGKSCYDVLTYILDTLHATISWYRGAWLIARETNVTMTSGKVRYFNTSGNSALFAGSSVQVGGAYNSNMWPVGSLTQAIDPAKKSVTVQAPWHTVRGLANPDMDRDASWVKNSGATFESSPGCYSLPYLGASSPGYACIKQDLQMAGLRVPMSFSLKGTGLGRIQAGDPRTPYWTNGAVFAVIAYTIGSTTYILRQGEEGFEWKEGQLPNFDLFYFSSGNGEGIPSKSFDTAMADRIGAEELTIDSIPAFEQSGSFPAGTLTVYIAGLNCYLYGAEINVILPKGYQDRLHLDNGARGEGEEVEVAIGRETSAIDYYKAFLQGILLDSGALITSFSDANFASSLDFLSFISRDYALSKALPRLKQTGKVFIESAVEFIPLVLTKGALDYWLETYAWDLFEDEVDVEALSLPGGSITVQSETVSEAGGTTGSSASGSYAGGGSSSMVGVIPADYFEEDVTFDGGIKLKDAFTNGLRIPGLRFGIGRTDFDLEVRNIAGEGETPVWVLHSPLPLITEGDQIVHSGTPGGGGGGGAQYLWQLDDVNVPTDPLEIVDGQALLWNAATQRWINANVVTDLSNYYTKAQTYSKTEVDGMVEDIGDAMDNLQAQIDAVSSRDMFDELTASVFFADIIAASDIYGALHGDADNALSLEGHAASYFAAAGDVTALENNFDSSGNAKAALKLTTSGPLNIWGVQYWNNGIPSDVTGQPNLYIGSTQVQTVGNTQPLGGISTITLVAQSTRSTSGNVIEVVTESDGQGGTITYLHTTLPIISDGDQIVGDGTPGGGSGGGATYLHELLDVIANLVPSDGYLLAWDANATSQAGSTGAWKAISQSSVLAPVTALIPAQASASNQLADKDFVNSSIATATATYQGSYNLVSDLGLTTDATESQIGTALASAVSDEDNNDYAFVQIPTSDATPTEIARTDRYKYNGSAWVFEYSLNNSGYTAAQWAAINSGITTAKRQGYDAIAGYFDANGKLTPTHVGDLSATYALVSHTHTIAQVTNLQDELDALSARIDSVASRDDFDELTASVIFADIIAADIFYGDLEGNADTATDADKLDGQHGSYYATASAVSTLQDYFDASGNAKSALKLTTVSKTAWGRTFWTANGVPDSVSGDMDSVGKIAFTAQNTKSTTGFVLEVVTESDGQGGTITYLHTTLPIISDGDQIVGTGTPGGGGGGGVTYLRELLDVIDNLSPSDGYVLSWDASAMSQAGSTGAWKAISQSSLRPDLSNYYTKAETYSQAEVNALIGAIDQFHYEIAASTSAVVDPQSNVLYLIGPTGSGADKYEEYVYTNSTWTKIGDTSIDLSNYYTKSETYSKTEVDTALNGYVPTNRTVSGTGYLTGGGALSQNQTLDIAPTVKTKIDHGESAYSALPDINTLLDNLQAQVNAVSSRDCYDELTATVFYSDIVAATDIYGALHGDADNALNLEGHAASYFATASAVTTLQGYFDNSGNAKTALKLTTDGPLNLWGVEYWSSGIPKSATGRPSFGAGADVPAGQTFKIGDATFSWVAGSNGGPGYLYVDTAFMSAGDQIIGSGTPGQGGGGGGKNYLQELLDTAYGWSDAFLAGVSEQQVLVFTPGADSKNGTGTGAWSYVPKTAVGAFYTAGTGLALSNANVFSLDVDAAKTALGLGDAAYLGVASAIGSSVTGLVSGALLYGVLGDSFDSTNTVKAFVNSSIATATATFRGTNTTATTEAAFLTWANALTHDLNDYVFWQTTDSYGNTIYKRYKFDGTSWVFEYNLNNSSFTTAQWDAINSGITSTKRSGYDTIVGYFTNGQLQAAHVGDLSGTYLPKSGGSMNNTTVVTNLNADLLDGKHASDFAAATHSHTISQVTNLESNLDTLSGRIDAIGSRNMFDELSASVFFSDIITASTAYIESIVGSLTGTASNASQLEGHAASYFATASSLNSYLLLSGGKMTGELYVNYSNDVAPSGGGSLIIGTKTSTNLAMDDNEIMARNNGAVSVLYLNAEGGNVIINETAGNTGIGVSSPAAKLSVGGSIELYSAGSSWNEGIRMHPATNGWSGIVFCEASNSGSTGTSANTWSIHNHEGVFGMYKNGSNKSDTNSYLDNTSGAWGMGGNLTIAGSLVTSGDQTISSDETLKMNLEDIRLSAKDIAGVRAVTFDWKDGRGRSFGTIAQDWLGILPEAVSGEEGNYSVAYAQAAMVAAVVNSREIVEIEKRETERDKEIRELKAALGKANVRITDLEKEVERLRMN